MLPSLSETATDFWFYVPDVQLNLVTPHISLNAEPISQLITLKKMENNNPTLLLMPRVIHSIHKYFNIFPIDELINFFLQLQQEFYGHPSSN